MKFLSPSILCIAAIATLTFPSVTAQDETVITIRKGDSINLAVTPISGPLGSAVSPVLQNDLSIIGSFSLVAPGQAAYIVEGSTSGSELKGELKDRSGKTVLSKSYSGSPRSLAHQFADDIVETLTDNPGIANSRIAFVSDRTGKKEIYTADYDGANVQQLTKDGVISVAPALSPDGRRLAYTGYQTGYADIYVIDLNSGSRNRIVKFPGTNSGAAFSPDGSRIACSVSKDGNPELYVIGANGSGARRLTGTAGVESSPSWSPDGREIVYSFDGGGSPRLFRIGSGGGTARAIPTGYGYTTEPSWSPDGSKIASTVRSDGSSIAVTDLRSSGTKIVAGGGQDPAWGANSRHLIYSSGSSIILLDTQSGRPVPIITGMGRVSEPTWSRTLK